MVVSSSVNTYLTGLFNVLSCSMAAYENASSAAKGTAREQCIDTLLQACLPSRYTIAHGDVIDSLGHETGQIDGVVIFSTASVLRVPLADIALIPAESVGGIFEVKSNVAKQWNDIKAKFAKVAPIVVKWPTGTQAVSKHDPYDSLAFHVVGYRGFNQGKQLEARLQELVEAGDGRKRLISIITLDPAAVAVVDRDMRVHVGPGDPGKVMAQWLYYLLLDMDTMINPRPRWEEYFPFG
jgi:hypothetical protein